MMMKGFMQIGLKCLEQENEVGEKGRCNCVGVLCDGFCRIGLWSVSLGLGLLV